MIYSTILRYEVLCLAMNRYDDTRSLDPPAQTELETQKVSTRPRQAASVKGRTNAAKDA